MLRPGAVAAISVALLGALAAPAWAQDDEPDGALRMPQRITVGVSDQFVGQLAPDEKTLYFVSNRDTRNEIFAQDMDEGHAHLVFDEGSDVTWPRVSPDGKALLYISFRDQATGQLCVRDLPDGGDRRCLGGGAALQAEWIDARRIAVVARTGIQDDLRVSEVTVGRSLSSRTILDKNLTSPAISPDGRWLVYVPLDRLVQRVGPAFAARAAPRMEAVRLDREGPPAPLVIDLPGMTGEPAFARDGKSLYFVQFFSDSNHDGVIDASDHSVLFRVPFPTSEDDAPARAAAAMPEQLTDTRLNCQYPAPSSTRLVATCSRGHDLDVYELPLDGEVPRDFTTERMRLEIELSSRRAEKLLLYRHWLARATTVVARRLLMVRLVMLHLDEEEFRAADFYARKVAALGDPMSASLAQPLLVLVEHRRARRAMERGRSLDAFADGARRHLDELRVDPGDPSAKVVLTHVVRSEIADAIGDKTRARQELEAVVVDEATPRSVIDAYYARADALYRELDDKAALVAVCRRLATEKKLRPDEQLEFAQATVRALVRGLPLDEASQVLVRERAATPGDGELGFALDLAQALNAIRDAHPPKPLVERLVALYAAQGRTGRKRAVVIDALERASDVDADRVLEALAERYADDVPPGTDERRRVERLYRRIFTGRAMRRMAAGRLSEARADFDAVVRRTGSLEAVVEAIELRARAGEPPERIQAEIGATAALGPQRAAPLARFVKAYLLARELPTLHGEEHARAVAEARAELRAAWTAIKTNRAAPALYGAIMHEEYLRTGALAAAESANHHYMVALELAAQSPRYRAMLLGQLGLLHVQVGNYRIALGYLEEREKLPFVDDAAGLAVRLATARALLHVGREKDAAARADEALVTIDGEPKLAPYRVLALDRAALYNLAADRFGRALTLYDAEVPLLAPAVDPASRRNLVVVCLARAAAALGAREPRRALDDLAAIDHALDDPAVIGALASAHVTAEQAGRSYRAIAAGLRANASLALGQLDAAEAALERRRVAFEQTLANSDRDEDLRALTLVETRLADGASDRRDFAAAARWLGLALDHADRLLDRTHGAIDLDELHVLWLAADLRTRTGVTMPFDVTARLRGAQAKMAMHPAAAYRTYERWFEIYLALLKQGGAGINARRSGP